MRKTLEFKYSAIVKDVHADENSMMIVDREGNTISWYLIMIAVFKKGAGHGATNIVIIVLVKASRSRQKDVVSSSGQSRQ